MSLQIGSADMAVQILRLPQVCAVTGLKRSMIYKLEAERRFPNRIKIGAFGDATARQDRRVEVLFATTNYIASN